MRVDYEKHLKKMIEEISRKTGFEGRPLSPSLVKMIEMELREDGAGVLVPYWFGVTERGRGPRKSTKDSGLWKIIYSWMKRKNMFRSKTETGRISEAKGMTWYINKYGNKHFRSKAVFDIYQTARDNCEKAVISEYGIAIDKVTKDLL